MRQSFGRIRHSGRELTAPGRRPSAGRSIIRPCMEPTGPPPPGDLPERIGPYRPLVRLGQGGMGVVYCAEDLRREGHLVALKVIAWRAETRHDNPALRFQREAKILESLRHPNIVSLYEVGSVGKQTYLAMELLDGTSLSAFHGLPWPQTVPLLVEICHGMAYLASHSIVHRDLSPDNILVVSRDGRPSPKILDFGIAKDTTRDETLHDFTRTGVLMGKPQYWSPEQVGVLARGETIDWRSDLYSCGIIFFRVLSGRFPFQAANPIEYVALHAASPAPPLSAPEGGLEIPEAIRTLVARMLAKNRTDRPGGWAEVEASLRSALAAATPELLARVGELAFPARGAIGRLFTRPGTSRGAPSMQRMPDGMIGGTPTLPTALGEPPPVALPRVPGRGRATPGRMAVAAALLVGLVAGGAALVRSLAGKPGKEGARSAGGVPAPAPTGTLALHSIPWARVVSIVEQSSGRRLDAPGETTPLLLSLPVGRYAVEVASGVGGDREVLAVEIREGRVESRSIVFAPSERSTSLLE